MPTGRREHRSTPEPVTPTTAEAVSPRERAGHRATLWGAGIGALATLLAAMVPALLARSTIERLNGEVQQQRQTLEGFGSAGAARWRISGRAIFQPGAVGAAGRRFTIYAVPGNNLVTRTSDDGRFRLEVPAGFYQILVIGEGTRAGVGLLEPNAAPDELKVQDANISLDYAPLDGTSQDPGGPGRMAGLSAVATPPKE
jgi:hypothetical protein